MTEEHRFPYPNFFEAVRYIARAFDLKQSNKLLDDKTFERVFDPRLLKQILDKDLYQVFEKYLGLDTKDILKQAIDSAFNEYASLVGTVIADGMPRSEMLKILQKSFISKYLANIMTDIQLSVGGPEAVTLFGNDTRAVDITLKWIKRNVGGWQQYLSSLEKEEKDRVSSWERGEDLPSSLSIYSLSSRSKGPWPEQIDWQRVTSLLFIARAIDFIKRDVEHHLLFNSVRQYLWGAKTSQLIENDIRLQQNRYLDDMKEIIPVIFSLQHDLRRTVRKSSAEMYLQYINIVRKRRSIIDISYWIDWHEARWHVYSGDLESANELYKKAFEDALFRSGENQKFIIEEALVVAASLKRPDKVFLKHLKWSMITFKYDIATTDSTKPSNKFNDSVEEWEIKLWKAHLHTVFPIEGLFPNVTIGAEEQKLGPLIINPLNLPEPDFRYPDRKIKVGETWKKTMPQLIFFLMIENYDVVEKLINEGASVNVTSESGDTPILIALGTMNITDVPYKTLDERFFGLISQQQHHVLTINQTTQKKRLLSIISAVQTGRLDVVRKVLELGADPNGRGETDRQTALNLAIKYIGWVKNPDKFWENQNAMPITPEALDSLRRHTAGSSGFTMEQQQEFLKMNKNDPRYRKIQSQIKQAMNSRITENMNLYSMREIAKLLIQSGADVNAVHVSPMKGYTPLMLATELDESELFDLMLINGGEPEKYYVDLKSKEKMNCWGIAEHFRAKNILRTLQYC